MPSPPLPQPDQWLRRDKEPRITHNTAACSAREARTQVLLSTRWLKEKLRGARLSHHLTLVHHISCYYCRTSPSDVFPVISSRRREETHTTRCPCQRPALAGAASSLLPRSPPNWREAQEGEGGVNGPPPARETAFSSNRRARDARVWDAPRPRLSAPAPAPSIQHPEGAPAEARPHPFPLAAAATRPGPFPEYSKT